MEKFTPLANIFTLPPAVTAWTNLTSAIGQRGDWPVVVKAWRKGDMVQAETLSGNEDQIIYCCKCLLIVKKCIISF